MAPEERKERVRVAVIGVGHLGKEHARVYRELPQADLVAVVDTDPGRARAVGDSLGVAHHTDLAGVIDQVEAASVVTPTISHREVASRLLGRGVATLVEKPMAATLEEAREMLRLAREGGAVLQVGHVERFNPIVRAAAERVRRPVFVECDRIHPYSFRSVDIGVVMDIMIHDLDLVLHLVDSPVVGIEALGTAVISPSEDLALARLTFENGCVAMVKSSRVAMTRSRKMRIFCPGVYISLDLAGRTGVEIRLKEGIQPGTLDHDELRRRAESGQEMAIFSELLRIDSLGAGTGEPLRHELEAFLRAARGEVPPAVPGEDGVRALEVALEVERCIRARTGPRGEGTENL